MPLGTCIVGDVVDTGSFFARQDVALQEDFLGSVAKVRGWPDTPSYPNNTTK